MAPWRHGDSTGLNCPVHDLSERKRGLRYRGRSAELSAEFVQSDCSSSTTLFTSSPVAPPWRGFRAVHYPAGRFGMSEGYYSTTADGRSSLRSNSGDPRQHSVVATTGPSDRGGIGSHWIGEPPCYTGRQVSWRKADPDGDEPRSSARALVSQLEVIVGLGWSTIDDPIPPIVVHLTLNQTAPGASAATLVDLPVLKRAGANVSTEIAEWTKGWRGISSDFDVRTKPTLDQNSMSPNPTRFCRGAEASRTRRGLRREGPASQVREAACPAN